MNPAFTGVARRQSFPCQAAAAECHSDSGIRDEEEAQHHLIPSLFSNTNQKAEADLINSWRIRNARGNILSVINISATEITKQSTSD